MDTPAPAPPQCLVFYGECLEGHDPMSVRLAVGASLKLDPQRTVRLFSGRRVVMKRGVSAEKAQAHVARFERMGARLRIEPMSMPRARSAAAAAASPAPAAAVPVPASPRARGWRALPWTAGGLLAGAAVAAVMLATQDTPPDPVTAAATRVTAAGLSTPPPALQPAALLTTGTAAPASAPEAAAAPEAPPEDMGPEARRELSARYLQAPMHRAFAFSPSGAFGWAGGATRDGEARDRALSQCLSRQPPGADQACRVVHVDGQWIE